MAFLGKSPQKQPCLALCGASTVLGLHVHPSTVCFKVYSFYLLCLWCLWGGAGHVCKVRAGMWDRDARSDGTTKAMPLGSSASRKDRLRKDTGIMESPLLGGLYLLPQVQ